MPPFLPRKRLASLPPRSSRITPAKRPRLGDALDGDNLNNRNPPANTLLAQLDGDSDSSLSDLDSDNVEDVSTPKKKGGKIANQDDEDDEEEEDIEWEDADLNAAPERTVHTPVIGDLQLTFRKDDELDYGTSAAASQGKKGPSKREKTVRINTHCMHVQLLLYHNSLRNNWVSDKTVQEILVNQLPPQIKKEVERWRTASGLPAEKSAAQESESSTKSKKKGKQKAKDDRNERDWGKPSQRLEPGKPNLSQGDPLVHLMKVLSAYWKKRFAITAPGLRKRGYGTKLFLKQEINSLRNDEHDPERHGERIRGLREFRELAKRCEGSRDVGAQLFTALMRGLGIESRLVASLQPSGYGWTKAEQMLQRKLGKTVIKSCSESSDESDEGVPRTMRVTGKAVSKSSRASSSKTVPKKGIKSAPINLESDEDQSNMEDDDSVVDITPSIPKQKPIKYDRDLAFPIYWTEVISPIDHKVLPVSPLVLKTPVASTPEVLSTFEPRGAKAEKGKQVMAYVVAFSPDGSAKDVTVRYLRKKLWPGKTKGFRLPLEKVPVYNKHGKVKKYDQYDWFKHVMLPYGRTDAMRTAVDDVEEKSDLVPTEPEKKKDGNAEVDTLQSLKASADFVLERFLKREEALRPNAKPERTFTSGKGDELKSELVYRRADVERCLTAESWHKEGRQPKTGENPMKMVPVRAVTLNRKREAEDHLRQTGEKQMQGLYCWDQTEYIIPPPIVDGVIPKNSYGNMDCFVPSMVPKGAVHVPLRGTVRICKKLEIDYAEAVTGFEFGNKRAVPVCTGVVVAKENEKALRDAWKKFSEEQKVKEDAKMKKLILDMWRKMIMGLRINMRVNEDYGNEEEEDEMQESSRTVRQPIDLDSGDGGGFLPDEEEVGGGFLLPHEEGLTGDDLVIESHEPELDRGRRARKKTEASQYPTPSSMPPPNRTGRNAGRSLLRAGSETSFSDLSSAVDLTDEDGGSKEPESDDGDTRYRRGGGMGSKKVRKPQMDDEISSDETEDEGDDTTQIRASSEGSEELSQDQESETSSGMENDEEYKPANKSSLKGGRPNLTKASPPQSETRRGRGRPIGSLKVEMNTPKRRGLRRDSTVVTSPYFGKE